MTFTREQLAEMLAWVPGRRVQFHPLYCPEAVGTDYQSWDTSHDLSVIRPDGTRVKLAQYKHASEALLSQMAPAIAQQLLDALAENERLREALEQIAHMGHDCPATIDAGLWESHRARLMQRIARAALIPPHSGGTVAGNNGEK